MKKPISLVTFLSSILLAIAATFACCYSIGLVNDGKIRADIVKEEQDNYNEKISGLDKLAEINKIICENAIENPDMSNIQEELIREYIDFIDDDYIQYFSPEQFKAYKTDLDGDYIGIGITWEFDELLSGAKIITVEINSPAENNGLKPGNIIVAVNKKQINKDNYESVLAECVGKEGESVHITYKTSMDSYKLEHKKSILFDKVEKTHVKYEKLDSDIAFISIMDFDSGAEDKFDTVITKAMSEGCKAVVFDVRDNPGGNLQTVVKMLNRLLTEGKLVTVRSGTAQNRTYSSTNEKSINIPMTVLINGNTASAAELFAIALRERASAKIIGQQSYGKGCVQTLYDFEDGSGFKLTTAMFDSPNGNNYNGKGITPDVECVNDDKNDIQKSTAIEEALKSIRN